MMEVQRWPATEIAEVRPMISTSSCLCGLVCFIHLAGGQLAFAPAHVLPVRSVSSFPGGERR